MDTDRIESDADSEFERLLREGSAVADTAPAGAARPGALHRALMVAVAFVALAGLGCVAWGVWGWGQAAASPVATDTRPESDRTTEASDETAAVEPDVEPVLPVEPSRPAALRNGADPVWVARVAAESGIPERALFAYASAALTLSREQPGCGIGWNTLAAIGYVESEHGSLNGGVLAPGGMVLPRVVGVPLDGTEFSAVPDTDGGALDGDPVWDRAVGPMQFIPQTWEQYGRDGNGDGIADIDQIDDAALSAATLLCEAGGDLRAPENWVAAVNAYNPSVAYNHAVVDAADRYAAFG